MRKIQSYDIQNFAESLTDAIEEVAAKIEQIEGIISGNEADSEYVDEDPSDDAVVETDDYDEDEEVVEDGDYGEEEVVEDDEGYDDSEEEVVEEEDEEEGEPTEERSYSKQDFSTRRRLSNRKKAVNFSASKTNDSAQAHLAAVKDFLNM